MTLERKNGKSLLQQFYVSDKIGSPISADDLKIIIEARRAEKETAARKKQKNQT